MKISKGLYYSVMIQLLIGSGLSIPVTAADFTLPITGGADEAYAGIRTGNEYIFNEDTTITVKEGDAVSLVDSTGGAKNYKILNSGKTLTLNAKETEESKDGKQHKLKAINLSSNSLTITAKRINLNATSSEQTRTEAVNIGSGNLTLNGDVYLQSINAGEVAIGIHGSGGKVTINGNFTAGDETNVGVDGQGGGFGYYGAAALYSHTGGQIVVNGDVMIHGNSNGLFVNMGNGTGTIDINGGGTILVDKENENGYAALRSECGVINMNVTKNAYGKVTDSGDRDVTIRGNVAVTTGAIHPNDRGIHTIINLGLGTSKSSLKGVIYNAFNRNGSYNPDAPNGKDVLFYGQSNLWLKNGAVWYNEEYGDAGGSWAGNPYKGSIVSRLEGGSNAEESGIIFQNEKHPITVYKYSGHTKLFYNHDENKPTVFTGGDFIIESAEKDSGISLFTDQKGLKVKSSDINDQKLVKDTLSALAQKLVYQFYAKGENNLKGKVGITEGLTASSATMRLEDITFDKTTGRGSLGELKVKTKFSTTLTGNMGTDTEYVGAGVLSENNKAVFIAPATIDTNNAPAIQPRKGEELAIDFKTNGLSINTTAGSNEQYGILVNGAELDPTNSGEIRITGKGKVVGMAALSPEDHSGERSGIWLGQAKGNIYINTSHIGILTKGYVSKANSWGGVSDTGSLISLSMKDKEIVITNTEKNNSGFIGIKSEDKGVTNISGHVIVDSGEGKAISAYGERSEVSISRGAELQGAGDILIEASEGGYVNLKPGNGEKEGLYLIAGEGKTAIKAETGKISIGTKKGITKIQGNVVIGDLAAEINLGNSSFFEGDLIYNGRKEASNSKIYMGEGSVWCRKGDVGKNLVINNLEIENSGKDDISKLSKIDQTEGTDLIINKLKNSLYGTLQVLYTPDTNAPTVIKGGSFVVNDGSLEKGTELLLTADGTQLNGNRDMYDNVLKELAHKLIYKKNDDALFGKVSIAESMKNSGNLLTYGYVSFDEKGVGQYIPQDITYFTDTLTGEKDKDKIYKEHGVRISDALYSITKDTTIDVKDDSAIRIEKEKSIRFDGGNCELNLSGKNNIIKFGEEGNDVDLNFVNLRNINIFNKDDRADVGLYIKKSGVSLTSDTEINMNLTKEISKKGTYVPIYVGEGGKLETGSWSKDNVKFNIHLSNGTAIVSDTSGKINLRNDNNEIVVEKGFLFQAKNKTTGEFTIKGRELLGDIDLRDTSEDEETSNEISVSKNNGIWSGGILNDEKNKGKITVNLGAPQNGSEMQALWINEFQNAELARDQYVDELDGSMMSGPYIGAVYMKDTHRLTINQMWFNTRFYYDHDKTDPTKLLGGDVVIKDVRGAQAKVYVRTDAEGIDLSDENLVKGVLNALANKIYYSGYVNGDKKLSGVVEIAEGLTSPSVFRYGDMKFRETDGQGYFEGTPFVPKQIGTEFTTPIAGMREQVYIDAGVLEKDKATGYYLFNEDSRIVANADIPADALIKSSSDKNKTKYAPIYVNMNGKKMVLQNIDHAKDDRMGIFADDNSIHIDNAKEIDIHVENKDGNAVGIFAKGVNGKLLVENTTNINASGSGIVSDAGDVTIKGAITIKSKNGVKVKNRGIVNLEQVVEITAEDTAIDAEENSEIKVRTEEGAITGRITGKGNIHLALGRKAIWKNTGESRLAILNGNGIVDMTQTGTGKTEIETYNGNTTVIYKHDKTDPKKMIGGDFIINKAEKDSMITLRTDNDGMNMESDKAEDKNLVNETLNALANKLYYTAYKDGEKNLTGKAEIAEGLTAQSASKRLENMTFKKENGQGQYLFDPAVDPNPNPNPNPNPDPDPKPPVIYGPKQTAMMRGAKSAMTTTMLSMRDNMTGMTQRLGDIHEGTEDGIWARTYGGKANYDKDLTKTKESFWGVQMGADKKQKSGWHTGVSFDYQDGNATYELGGKGDPKLYTLGIYGTKVKDNGEYIDIVAKAGRGQNDYTVYNDMGHKLKGDYKANAIGLSVEYGKKIEKDNMYLTPQIQLSYMKLQGTDYEAISDYANGKKMHVEQDGMTSLVGRIGIAAGKRTDKTDLYLKANLLHEFKGTTASTFSAENEPTGKVDQDFGDTWAELTMGINHNIDKDKMIYADITKSFGGDYEMEWKANAGIRLRF